MTKFHERLRQLRDESGETQAKIAEALEITPQNLSYYMKGREPNFDLLAKMAKYFNVTTDYLLGLSDNKTTKNVNIGERLGLSDETITFLEECKRDNDVPISKSQIINFMIAQEEFDMCVEMIRDYFLYRVTPDEMYDEASKTIEHNFRIQKTEYITGEYIKELENKNIFLVSRFVYSQFLLEEAKKIMFFLLDGFTSENYRVENGKIVYTDR